MTEVELNPCGVKPGMMEVGSNDVGGGTTEGNCGTCRFYPGSHAPHGNVTMTAPQSANAAAIKVNLTGDATHPKKGSHAAHGSQSIKLTSVNVGAGSKPALLHFGTD
jgi:hypothetical protein